MLQTLNVLKSNFEHGQSVAVFWLSNVQKNDHLNLEKCTRQLIRMMDLMPSDLLRCPLDSYANPRLRLGFA